MIAGNAPYTFTASNVTVTPAPTGVTINTLSDIGMFLNAKTGVLDGRPLYAGLVSFHADCVDKNGFHALSRDKTSVGQTISFNVVPATRVATALFSTKLSIKGNLTSTGKDGIAYTGLLDLGDFQVSDLNGLGVTLSIANYQSPTVILNNGSGSSTGTPAMSVKLSSSGMLSITIKDESFGQAGSIVNENQVQQSPLILVVNVDIVNPTDDTVLPQYHSSELLRFKVSAKGPKFDLEYKFGPNNLGGGFFITQVAGKDDKSETGDAWKVSFICLPPSGKKLSSFGAITNANVSIGTDFFNTIGVSLVSNGDAVKSAKNKTSGAVVTSFSMNDKTGKGGATTGLLPYLSALPNTQTQIPPALKVTKAPFHTQFPFVFTLSDANNKELFGAEGNRRINAKGDQWVDKNLNK